MAVLPVFRLPSELWDNILGKVNTSDQLQVALSCTALTDVALRSMYHNLTFKIPEGAGGAEKALAPFLACTDTALNHVRHISVTHSPFRQSPASGIRPTPTEDTQWSVDLDRDLKRVLLRLPDHTLVSLNFLRSPGIKQETLELVVRRHYKSLRKLSIFAAWDFNYLNRTWPQVCPTSLLRLDWRSIHSTCCTPGIYILFENRQTLQELTVGRQDEIFELYQAVDPQSDPQWSKDFHTALKLSDLLRENIATREVSYPKLCTLRIIGIALEVADRSIPFGHIHHLSLESCPGSEKFLADIVRTRALYRGDRSLTSMISFPNLKEFVFRHEEPTETLKDSLKMFLSSFSGLRLLSILLDNVSEMIHPSCFTNTHGSTLEILVFEGRRCPRNNFWETSLSLGRRTDPDSQISAIFSSCPRLRELGIPMRWQDPLETLLGPGPHQRQLEIPHLSTLHIRNAPEWKVNALPYLPCAKPNHSSVPILRYDFLEDCLDALMLDLGCQDLGNLSVVAVGPPTFSDSRSLPDPKVSSIRNEPMWNHVLFYTPTVARGRKGRKRVLLAELGMAINLEEAKKDFPEGEFRCFDSYWLK